MFLFALTGFTECPRSQSDVCSCRCHALEAVSEDVNGMMATVTPSSHDEGCRTSLPWRRVSSTHHLGDLWASESNAPQQANGSLLGGMLGCIMIFLSLGCAVALLYVAMCLAHRSCAERWDAQLFVWQASCVLVPSTTVFAFMNWFSIKLFKHNT